MRKFYCYSARLNRFLQSNGLKPLYMFVSKSNGKEVACHVYNGTDKLNQLKNDVYPLMRDKF